MSEPKRTDEELVKGVLRDDYGPKRDGTLPDLTPDIRSANLIVDQVVVCAADKGFILGEDLLAELETQLAAHSYKLSDPAYKTRTTGRSSGSFEGETGMYLEGTKYGQQAMVLDYTSCLKSIGKPNGGEVGGIWLGLRPSEQTEVWNRD